MKKYIFALLIVIILSSCSNKLYEVKETKEMMGTIVSITVHHEDKEIARRSIDNAFQEMSKIDSLLSSYKNTSEVSILNRDKQSTSASEDFQDNIQKSLYYGNLSNGAFDITVQPILDLYTKSFRKNKRPPSKEEIDAELKKIDWEKITIKQNTISIGNNQKITLGGIAKGYAVDKAVESLKTDGINNALVNAGGDMRTIGKKYNTQEWNIALANPRDKNDYITIIPVSNKAIVTSGDYERYYENKSFHHIVDPRTGYSAAELMSVTIITDSAFDADAISTAVFVLGKEEGLKFIENLNNTEGLIITKDKEIVKSSSFPLTSIN